MCVCVCVCVCFCIVMRDTLSIWFKNKNYKIFHLSVHYVCMFVQRFEPQGRRFTNMSIIIICRACTEFDSEEISGRGVGVAKLSST